MAPGPAPHKTVDTDPEKKNTSKPSLLSLTLPRRKCRGCSGYVCGTPCGTPLRWRLTGLPGPIVRRGVRRGHVARPCRALFYRKGRATAIGPDWLRPPASRQGASARILLEREARLRSITRLPTHRGLNARTSRAPRHRPRPPSPSALDASRAKKRCGDAKLASVLDRAWPEMSISATGDPAEKRVPLMRTHVQCPPQPSQRPGPRHPLKDTFPCHMPDTANRARSPRPAASPVVKTMGRKRGAHFRPPRQRPRLPALPPQRPDQKRKSGRKQKSHRTPSIAAAAHQFSTLHTVHQTRPPTPNVTEPQFSSTRANFRPVASFSPPRPLP